MRAAESCDRPHREGEREEKGENGKMWRMNPPLEIPNVYTAYS